MLLPVCHVRTPSTSFPLYKKMWIHACVGHFASRVTFILYMCKGYGVFHNALCSFINVLFQTGLKRNTTWHFPSSQRRWFKREIHRWEIPPPSTTVLSSTGKGSHVWVVCLMCLRNSTEHNTGSLWTQADRLFIHPAAPGPHESSNDHIALSANQTEGGGLTFR